MIPSETSSLLHSAPLGKTSSYINTYTPTLLFPLPTKRDEIGITDVLPFSGFDLWTAYEVSWLNPKGKPMVAIAEFSIPSDSKYLIESKSFKLYLNSFNNSHFESLDHVKTIMTQDLSKATETEIGIHLWKLKEASTKIETLSGLCLDELDIECTKYQPNTSYLKTEPLPTEETLYTNLLKSNCLVTGQPDWGTVCIQYQGNRIDHAGLLKYIVSLRDHNEFHEQCVERIFMDIMRQCHPKELSVYARYTRRGGLDINPFRTYGKSNLFISKNRLVRQ